MTYHAPPPGWPEPDPWAPLLAGIVQLLREDREQGAQHREQQPEATPPGPELRILGEAVGRLVVDLVVAADPARRARLRGPLLEILRLAQGIDTEVAA